MATTPSGGYPYPIGTDLVRDGDNAIQALAIALDGSAWTAISAASGFTSNGAQYRKIGSLVYLRGAFTPSAGNYTAPSTNTVSTALPASARPPISRQYAAACQWGGGLFLVRVDVTNTGSIIVYVNTGTTTNQVWLDGITYHTD